MMIIIPTQRKRIASLGIASLALAWLLLSNGCGSRHSGTEWEYQTLYRTRDFMPRGGYGFLKFGTEWSYPENTKNLSGEAFLKAKLKELGDQGWELVAISPRSGIAANGDDWDIAGATTEELWVFKRAK